MSRIDDELKIAFRRQEPSANFTKRVIAQIGRQPAKKPNLWRRLASMLQPPKLRWVAVGLVASLVVVIGSLQLTSVKEPEPDEKTAQVPGPEPSNRIVNGGLGNALTTNGNQEKGAPKKHRPVRRRGRTPLSSSDSQIIAQGEAAKQQLMMALHIASATLNEAQRIVQGSSGEMTNEPKDNR